MFLYYYLYLHRHYISIFIQKQSIAMDSTISDQSDEPSTSRSTRRSRILHRPSEEDSTDFDDSQRVDYYEKSDNSINIGDSTFEEAVDTLKNMSNQTPTVNSDNEMKTSTDEEPITPPRKRKKLPATKTIPSKSFNTRSKAKLSKGPANKSVSPQRPKRATKDKSNTSKDCIPPKKVDQLPPPKKAAPKKITQSSKESPKAGSSTDGDSVSAGKSNTLGRKQKSTTKLPPPQSQPLDLSFDDSEGNSQSILKGASKSYFQKTTPVSKQPKTTETASTDVNPEDEDEELIPPSQNTTKRRTHFPLSLAGLDKDGNKESSRKGKMSLKSKAKNSNPNQPIVVSDEEVGMRKELMSKLNTAFDTELKNQKSEVNMWAKLMQAKVNRIPEDNVREKLMHHINELVIKALDGSWPENANDSPLVSAPIQPQIHQDRDNPAGVSQSSRVIPTLPHVGAFRQRSEIHMPSPQVHQNTANVGPMMNTMVNPPQIMWQHPPTPSSLYRLMASQGFDPSTLITQNMRPIHQPGPNVDQEGQHESESELTTL